MSGSTKGPPRPSRRPIQIRAAVGVDGELAPVLTESNRLTALRDRLSADVVLRHATGRRVLDLGRGAPQVADWIEPRVERLTVIDAIDLARGADPRVPLPDASVDCVYALRTLPHLGRDQESSEAALHAILRELSRVLTPGGVAIVELNNARSPIGLYHGVRRPTRVLSGAPLVIDSPGGVTRFDTLGRVIGTLPPTLTPIDLHGIRLAVASPHLLLVPVLGRILTRMEWWARDQPLLRRFAAHFLLVLRRLTPARPRR